MSPKPLTCFLSCYVYHSGKSETTVLFFVQVLDRGLFHCDNCYKIPNLRCTGYVCKTNTPSNTAFRGFGGPQGMMFAEQYITDVAVTLGISPVKVRSVVMGYNVFS